MSNAERREELAAGIIAIDDARREAGLTLNSPEWIATAGDRYRSEHGTDPS
jgi:hypothetical protein